MADAGARDAADLARLIRLGQLPPREAAALARLAAVNPRLNAVVRLAEVAMAAAKARPSPGSCCR
jgi:hypothetical protein